MAKMAKDFHAVPIAGVGVERIFSLAHDIVTYRRNRLKGETISDVLIAKEFWRSYEDQTLAAEEEEFEKEIREDEFYDQLLANELHTNGISDVEEGNDEQEDGAENSAEEDVEEEEEEEGRQRKRKRAMQKANRNVVNTYGKQKAT